MRIQRIYIEQKLPACQGVIKIAPSQRGRNKSLGQKCRNKAKYILGDKPFCIRCAQRRALEILLSLADDGK